jgi:magnesium-transporting ATPase (P-type)
VKAAFGWHEACSVSRSPVITTERSRQMERPEPGQWHVLDVAEVETTLQTSADGLSEDEAGARRERYGPNRLEEAPPPSVLALLLHQFQSPLIYILLVATVITLLLGEYIDAAVIAAVLVLNAVIGFTQERRAEQSVRALMQLVAPRAHVVREGQEREIDSVDLVPGDLVLLESGSRVPADLRLMAATSLQVDESLLTGESKPVRKAEEPLEMEEVALADRTNMAYSGAIVTSGRGRGYVVATGGETVLGSIAAQVRGEERRPTPLQQRMTRFAHVVAIAVAASAGAAFLLGVALGISPAEMFLVAVALAVAAVPEGLPVVFTITLAVGVRRMARRQAIIRRLPAVETLGSTTAIGSDKTGTLTENRMTVQQIWAAGTTTEVPADGDAGASAGDSTANRESLEADEAGALTCELETVLSERKALCLALLTGVLTNEAQFQNMAEDVDALGDPTETALLLSAARLGLDPTAARDAFPVHAELPFEPERRFSASIRHHDGAYFLFVKGAPERVTGMCRQMLGPDGEMALEPDTIGRAADELAAQGLRVLAMAYRPLSGRPEAAEIPEPEDLTFLGLQGMMDPPRPGVLEAIAGCREAGIRVIMITGDHAATAQAIGRMVGIGEADTPVVTGIELEKMDDETLRQKAGEVPIYARVAPEHKLRVVRALRARGDVVAVTGDGVNDAPALKAADIGIAMGKSGTDVAREASDMVLTDDNFVSIYAAVEEGRVTFDNLRKVTFFLISTGAAMILAILTALALRWPLPFLPAQVLWLNLVTNGLQDVALAFEPGEPDALKRRPRHPDEGIVSALLWERTAITGLVMAAGTLALFWWELNRTDSLIQAQTVALTTMVLFQVFHVGNARSEYRSVFTINPFSNRFLFIAVAAALAVHIAAISLPPTQYILRVEPIELDSWLRIILVAATIIPVMELHKLLRRGHRDVPRTRGQAT